MKSLSRTIIDPLSLDRLPVVLVLLLTITIHLVVLEASSVGIAIHLDQFTFTMSFVSFEYSYIAITIGEALGAMAFLAVIFPVADIGIATDPLELA